MLLLHFFFGSRDIVSLFGINPQMQLAFSFDPLSFFFCALVSFLWPFALLYAAEYMQNEPRQSTFFAFFLITYGVVLGIAFAANFFTLYFFYELLTLSTLPLVMITMTGQAKYAGKKYLAYSMSGAAAVFIGMAFLMQNGNPLFFLAGGCVKNFPAAAQTLPALYLLLFCGFGVKAALWPLHGWLPTAGVAPTPVTALLHAVAVVNSGVFAIFRLTYYCIGAETLSGTWAQFAAMALSVCSILFGSAMALRYQHLKRRLAYSTVSNLSYLLFSVTLLSPAGASACLFHMIAHSFFKIVLFFCSGAVLCQTHHKGEYLFQLGGFGKKMPVTFFCFLLASLGLIGIPPFLGYQSKWFLASAALKNGSPLALAGAAALCVSAFLTGLYLFGILLPAYFPSRSDLSRAIETDGDPGWKMTLAIVFLTVCGFLFIFAIGPLSAVTEKIGSLIG